MGFQTQSVQSGQGYPMASMSSLTGIGETSLARQRSIYSLTLEEFQNNLREPSKSFGSMNMEELLKNIWTAEESQAMVAAIGTADGSGTGLPKQLSLQRQGSSTLRTAVSRKSVDEVWRSIYQGQTDIGGQGLTSKSEQQREMTFGEMTLEDFLVKAGVVREEDRAANADQPFIPFAANAGVDKTGGCQMASMAIPSSTIAPTTRNVVPGLPSVKGVQTDAELLPLQPAHLFNRPFQNTPVQKQQQPHGNLFEPPTAEVGVIYSNSGKPAGGGSLIPAAVGLGGLASPVGGGIAASLNTGMNCGFNNGISLSVPTLKADSPYSHSSDGAGLSHGNMQLSPVVQSGLYGLHGPTRKRSPEEPVHRALERRQRRMIKNRESAARSRARKQAYTMELEDEMTQLKEENLKLKKKQEEAEKRKKQVMAVMPVLSQQAQNEEKALRRTRTGPW